MDESLSLDSQVKLPSDSEQFDLTAYAVALAFNNAALPPDMPEWLKGLIQSHATTVRQASAANDPNDLNNPNSPDAKREREKRNDEAADVQIAAIEQREEWARTQHSFAGATMTGQEWAEVAEELKRDGKFREWLVRELMKDGGSKTDAERKADEIADIATIMSKPRSEWTAADRAKIDRGKSDPQIQKVMTKLEEQKLDGADTLKQTDIAHDHRETSVAARADAFGSAPGLKEHHQAAVAATVPLDQAAPPSTESAPKSQPNMAGLTL